MIGPLRAPAITAATVLAAVVLGCASASAQPSEEKVEVQGYNGDKLDIAVYSNTDRIELDVSGLQVDLACAKRYGWNVGPSRMRVALLKEGCAKITGSSPPAAEVEAQQNAQNAKRNLWADTPATTTAPPPTSAVPPPTGPSPIDGVLKWLGANALAVLGVVLALLAVPGVIKWLRRRKYKASVDVVLFGLSSAGKTDLWTAWADGSAPHSNAKPTAVTQRKTGLMPIVSGEYTLHPSVVDGVGGDPAGMLDSMRGAPRRHKRVLVFVVAPTRRNEVQSPAIEPEFVTEQMGYSAFPRALIGTKAKQLRPDLVVLFFAKFDLLSDLKPDDSASQAARTELMAAFSGLRHAVEQVSRKSHLEPVVIVGSSKHGWGIEELRRRITETIFARPGSG